MIEHIILVKFGAETTQAQIQESIDRLVDLKNHIPGIIDIAAGHNFSSRNKGYQMGLTVRFDSRESLAAYGPHPRHQACVDYMNSVGREDTIAVDFEF